MADNKFQTPEAGPLPSVGRLRRCSAEVENPILWYVAFYGYNSGALLLDITQSP